jgi:hypothetical protein
MDVCTSLSWITVPLFLVFIRTAINEMVKVYWQFPNHVVTRGRTQPQYICLIYTKAITDTETS